MSFSIKADSTVSLYRARVDNKNVILRVLKGTVPLSEMLYFIIDLMVIGDTLNKWKL